MIGRLRLFVAVFALATVANVSARATIPVTAIVSSGGTLTLHSSEAADSYVTLDEVMQMYNNGHEIGVHTRTHPNLTTLTDAQMTDEILGAPAKFGPSRPTSIAN